MFLFLVFFASEILNLYKQKVFTDFKDFDFLEIQTEFEEFLKDDRTYRKFISKHFSCTYDVAKAMECKANKSNKKIKNDKI